MTSQVLLRVAPPVLIFIAFGIGYATGPGSAGRAYFEAAAQVMPVLLLALAIETRWLRIDAVIPRLADDVKAHDWGVAWDRSWAIVVLALPIVVLCYAEWDSLGNVADLGATGEADTKWVSGGVLLGLTGVALSAFFGLGPESDSPASSDS
jgi:hypothetical protein